MAGLQRGMPAAVYVVFFGTALAWMSISLASLSVSRTARPSFNVIPSCKSRSMVSPSNVLLPDEDAVFDLKVNRIRTGGTSSVDSDVCSCCNCNFFPKDRVLEGFKDSQREIERGMWDIESPGSVDRRINGEGAVNGRSVIADLSGNRGMRDRVVDEGMCTLRDSKGEGSSILQLRILKVLKLPQSRGIQ